MQPNLVVHADWGSDAKKRWMARAILRSDGKYHAQAPELVGEPGKLISKLRHDAGIRGCAFVGFDFPIGLPLRYAWRAGVGDFLTFLRVLGEGDWAEFYQVAEIPDDIGVWRPFYPARPGGTSQAQLLDGLGLDKAHLFRRCDRAQNGRKAAAPLFWTMGPQQAGKAAIIGWRDVLAPAVRAKLLSIWPFSGSLFDLFQPGRVVAAETYPAECYRHLGINLAAKGADGRSGKRSQFSRQANADLLLNWAADAKIKLDDTLKSQIADGFGSTRDSEDRFDAVIGLFGMLNVVLKRRRPGDPVDDNVRKIEGWILGQYVGDA